MSSHDVDHLCVLIHGLWGSPTHLDHVRQSLAHQHPGDNIHILVAKNNSSSFTYDGIEIGGERIAHEVEEAIASLSNQGARLTKISVVGYSLGGLIARYAIGLMYQDGVFEKLKPMNFTTFASPHLGVRSPTQGFRGYFWNAVAARTLSASGRQMWIIDNFRDTQRPLLAILADPNSIFLRALKMFKHKSLYANTMNDRSVPFYTSAVSRVDPFVDLDAIDVHYIEDQEEEVILDPEEPVSLRKQRPIPGSLYERFQNIPSRTWNSIPFYAAVTLLLPVGLTLMLVNSGFQTIRSARRIQLHETGNASVNPKKYRVPLLEEVQAIQDQTMERLAGSATESYLPTPPPEGTPASAKASAGVSADAVSRAVDRERPKTGSDSFPILALAPEQFTMIDNLEEAGLTIYPVHIQKVRHTHAAIIVRMQRDSFSEGRAVVNHWAKNFEA